MSEPITHAELVRRAATWLRSRQRCSVIITEASSGYVGEIPDALGWRSWGISVLVECKVSRADYYADRSKKSRKKATPLGAVRYYMAPVGVIAPESLIDGWGLVEVSRCRNGKLRAVITTVAAEPAYDWGKLTERMPKEISLLVAELRRLTTITDWRIRCRHCGKPYRKVGLQVQETALDA